MEPDISKLRLATPDEIKQALTHALMFRGRKASRHAADFVAAAGAEIILEHLKMSDLVLMKQPPVTGSAPLMPDKHLTK